MCNFNLKMLRQFGWTYFSLVNSPDSYGDGGAISIQNILRTHPEYQICIAVYQRIPTGALAADYDYIVGKLMEFPTARGVIAYVSRYDFQGFFDAVRRRVGLGYFAFIVGDTLTLIGGQEYADVLEGTIYTDLPYSPIPGFQQYVWSLTYDQVRVSISGGSERLWKSDLVG